MISSTNILKLEISLGELMKRSEALDISRFAEEFGFQPEYTLEEGIREYADWLKKQLSKSNRPC